MFINYIKVQQDKEMLSDLETSEDRGTYSLLWVVCDQVLQ